jgi:hypothetical protein
MNCKTCDYPLWNLEQRQCPECGTAYKPSEFEFAINGVRFCCPHCRQAYYGTGLNGHLVPSAFACVTCQKNITMDETVLLPAQGVAEHQTRGDTMPWLERKRIGRWRGYWQTFSRAMNEPDRLIGLVPAERSGTEALKFALLTLVPLALANGLAFFLIGGVGSAARWVVGGPVGGGGVGGVSAVLPIFIMFVSPVVGSVVVVLTLLVLQSAIAHAVIMFTGGTDQPLRRMFHNTGYSSPTGIWWGIPCVGSILTPVVLIWWFVTTATMIRVTHRVSRLRAALAVGTLPVVSVLGFIMLVVVLPIYFPPAPVGAVRGVAAANPTSVGTALRAQLRSGSEYPAHGLLLLSHGVTLRDFITRTPTNQARVGDTTIAELEALPIAAAQEKVAQLAAALPADVVAHRVGDFVFVYHGISAANRSRSDLWAAVVARYNAKPSEKLTVIGADGTAYTLEDENGVDMLLAQQNSLRVAEGLEPLPDLWLEVTSVYVKGAAMAPPEPTGPKDESKSDLSPSASDDSDGDVEAPESREAPEPPPVPAPAPGRG